MRRFLSFTLAVVLMSSVSFAQVAKTVSLKNAEKALITAQKSMTSTSGVKAMNAVHFSEDFEGGAMPTGWTEQLGAATQGWTFNTDASSAYWSIPAHTTYACINDDECNCDMGDVWLITPSIDLSAAPAPVLKFTAWMNNDVFTIKTSIDGGTNWTDLQTMTANGGWEDQVIDLTSVANQADVMIAFHYNDNGAWGYGWALDDVVVEDAATTPDLVVSPAGFTAEYYAVPFEQATFIPQGNVENIGTDLNSAVNLDLAVTGGYTDAQAITTPLANGANEDLTFASFTAASAGTATFTYTATLATDADPSNNTFAKDIEIGVELARDNGIAAGNIGVGTPDEEMGNIFTITTADTVTSVKWVMAGTAGDEVSIIIRNFTTEPTTEVGRSLPVTNDGSAEYEANMVGLVVLQPGTYFIGAIEGANNLGMEYTTTPYITGTAWAHFNSAWNDLGALGYEHTYHIRPQFNNVVPTADDVAMVSINTVTTMVPGDLDITGTIRNMGNMGDLTSFDVVYTIDGGAASAVYNVTGQTIAPGATFDFTHNVPYTATMGSHTIEVTISNPNGNTDENPGDNVMSTNLSVINEIFPKTVVYEEGTGTWCGWCVRGLVGLNTMADNITDGTWIGIGVHNGDPMAVTEYDNAVGTFISGYPSGIMDRHPVDIDPGLSELESYYNVRKLEIPVAKAVIDNGTYNPTTREMIIDIESFFALDIASADYNAAIIVVEDGVTGTGSGWEQANYYDGGGSGPMTDYDGTDYTTAGNPVPAADMTYNHVGRALLGGWSGEAGSIPSSVVYGTGYVHTYNHTLPADQVFDNISLVGIVIDNANGQIINATEVHAADVLTVGISKVNNSNFSIFPNPTTGLVKVEGVEGAQVVVYNMIGEVVYTEANASATTTIDLSSYNAGNYIVKVINDNEVSTQKIVLTK